MKVQELLEASKASSVQIKNKAGVFKKFKSMDSPGANQWRMSWDDPEKDKANAKAEKDRAKKFADSKKVSDADIIEHADYALTSALDGGDPMDTIGPWMEKKDVDMDRIDAVVNKKYKLKGGLYGYIAQSWGDMQRDRMSDAKRELEKTGAKKLKGDDGYNDQFYDVKDGKVVARENPWGTEG